MVSTCGGSVWVRASLTTTAGMFGAAGSARPGEPPSAMLARQLLGLVHVLSGALSLRMTSEKPAPSVVGYHASLKLKSRIGSWRPPSSARRSPALSKLPVNAPAMLVTVG